MTKTILPRALLAVGAFALLTGFGRCGHHRSLDPERVQRHVAHHVDDFVDDVDADASQAAQIRALTRSVTDELPAVMKGHRRLKARLAEAWAAPEPDRAALHADLDQQLERVSALLHRLVDAGAELHGILTPEQRKAVSERFE